MVVMLVMQQQSYGSDVGDAATVMVVMLVMQQQSYGSDVGDAATAMQSALQEL
jgi:hypothetical protein